MNCKRCGILLGGDGDPRYARCRLHNDETCAGPDAVFHIACLDAHDLEMHVGPRERAIVEQWRAQAARA